METLKHDVTIPLELDGKRLDQALAELLPDYSRSRLKQWILDGQVVLDGNKPAPRTRVQSGQHVVLTAVMDDELPAEPEAMALDIVFEDEAVLVINKPAGLVVHPGAGVAGGTLMNGLLHYAPALAAVPRSGILHRLDKDTSGLLLVTKTLPAHTHLVQDLEHRRIRREYRAVSNGRLTAGGHIDAPVGRHPTHRTRMAVFKNEAKKGKPALTHYRVLARFAAHTFLALRLETGRTHQIRVHMAHVRHALVGDATYGGRLKVPSGASAELAETLRHFSRQALHASGLVFTHPVTGDVIELRSQLPADFVRLLNALDASDSSMPEDRDSRKADSGKSDPERWGPERWDSERWNKMQWPKTPSK
jgi:23S rRNA pseudouridine1911/1915/1917 synthase